MTEILSLLSKQTMIMDLQARTKEAAIDEMIACYARAGIITDSKLYRQDILKREHELSTGIGDGIAMPHAQDEAVTKPAVLFAKSKAGVDYQAIDKKPVHLFFMIAAPKNANQEHLQDLATLSRLLLDKSLVAKLKRAQSSDEVLTLFKEAETDQQTPKKKVRENAPFVIAVTACPTGIAHTYMAEESLNKTAQKMGVAIKVETNGSEGVKHKLTAQDIKRAQGVIIAADKKVEMVRFDGKPLINQPVIDGIKKPEELINTILQHKAPVYHSAGEVKKTGSTTNSEKKGIWQKVYQDLMNGISNMLPFVVGGGILMAISFMLEQAAGKNSTSFVFLNSLGNYAFSFLIPILAGFVAYSIGDRPALMPGFVGGYMATQPAASVIQSKGDSGFIGGIIAGFLAGYIIWGLRKAFKKMPKSLDSLKPMIIFPVLGLLIIGLLMYFIIDPIFSVINLALVHFLTHMGTANAVVLGAILGGMQAVDLGGPVNKAAYTTAIGVLAETGNGSMMASVMIGGMVPPLAIAFATAVWRQKFTENERKAGISNWVLGISFITEGAIPFAISDPLRVIGSSIIGSAIGGALAQFWRVSVPAPHGGLWVILLIHNAPFFVVSLAIGMLIAGTIYGLWRRPAQVANN